MTKNWSIVGQDLLKVVRTGGGGGVLMLGLRPADRRGLRRLSLTAAISSSASILKAAAVMYLRVAGWRHFTGRLP